MGQHGDHHRRRVNCAGGFSERGRRRCEPTLLSATQWQQLLQPVGLGQSMTASLGCKELVTHWGCGGAGHESGPITPGTTDLITILLTPVAIAMVIYALFCFYWRSVFLRKKQVRHFLLLVGLFGYISPWFCNLCLSTCSLLLSEH